jgi:hypothetical protein
MGYLDRYKVGRGFSEINAFESVVPGILDDLAIIV